jgi:Zn finger protein HypA/HybF (possibly regulating hydrogenase expression)
MHELSIIQNILDIAQREAFNHGSNKVNEISVEVGTLTGVNIEFLRFSFDTVKKVTFLRIVS